MLVEKLATKDIRSSQSAKVKVKAKAKAEL